MTYQHEDVAGTRVIRLLNICDILIKDVETIRSKQPRCILNDNA